MAVKSMTPRIDNISTELGQQILDDLAKDGWKKVSEYSCLAFDKGIDFDNCTVRKHHEKLYFEWTNWFEWEVTGTTSAIAMIADQYHLTVKR